MRQKIDMALKEAMKSKDVLRTSTLRLVVTAVKDREIALRADEAFEGLSDEDILAILTKMVRQRQESAQTYEEAGRLELAEQERAEIIVISEFLPKQLSDEEMQAAVDAAIAALEATSIRDMGRVMGALKGEYTGRVDFTKISALVKEKLGA